MIRYSVVSLRYATFSQCNFFSTPSLSFASIQNAKHEMFQLPEVIDSIKLNQKGKYIAAASHLQRAIDITNILPNALFSVVVQHQLAQIYQNAGDFIGESQARHIVFKLCNDADSGGVDAASLVSRAVCSLSMNSYRIGNISDGIDLASEYMASLQSRDDVDWDGVISCGIVAGIGHWLNNSNDSGEIFNTCATIAKIHLPKNHISNGDILLHIGNYHQINGQPDLACEYYTDALEWYEIHQSNHPTMPVVTALHKIGGRKNLTHALEITKDKTHNDSIEVAESLRRLAGDYHTPQESSDYQDGITAEGLFRSSLKILENAKPSNNFKMCLLYDCMLDYAFLLTHLSWNNVPRVKEAVHLLRKLKTIHQKYPTARASNRSFLYTGLDTDKMLDDVQTDEQLIELLKPVNDHIPQLEHWMFDQYNQTLDNES